MQVPPMIEKVPGPKSFAMAGAAVKANGAALAPEAVLVTVTKPLWVAPLPFTSVGLTGEYPRVAPVTWNVTPLLVPPGVVTVTVLDVCNAILAITQDALTVVAVGVPVMVQVTLPATPDTFTAVAPVRLVPVRVTETVVP